MHTRGTDAILLGHPVLRPPNSLQLLRQDKTLKLEQQLAEQKRESQRLASQASKAPADGWPPPRSAEALEELKTELQAQVIHLQQCVEQHRLRTADVSGTATTCFPANCEQQSLRADILCVVRTSLCAYSVISAHIDALKGFLACWWPKTALQGRQPVICVDRHRRAAVQGRRWTGLRWTSWPTAPAGA